MSWVAALVLAAVGGACVAALRWPLVGLLAYLWLDFMRPHDMYVELRSVRPMLVVGVVTMAVTAWRERRRLFDGWRRLLPVAVLAALVGLSVAVSVDAARSALMLLHMGKMLALVWLFDRLVRREGALRAVLWVIALSLAVLAAGAIGQATARGLLYEFRPELVIEGPQGLQDGAFRDNNDLARVLALSAPLWWALAVLHGAAWGRWLAGAGLLITVAAIECTFSRSGFVGLLVGAAGVALFYRPLWRSAVLWLAFVAVLLLLAPRTHVARVATIAAPMADASVQGRVRVWHEAGQMLTRRPLLGQGAGTFRFDAAAGPPVRRSSHSILLEAAVELGFLGLAAYGWVILAALARLQRAARAADLSWVPIAATGVHAALLAYLAAGLFLSGPLASPLFVLIGLSLAIEPHAPADSSA